MKQLQPRVVLSSNIMDPRTPRCPRMALGASRYMRLSLPLCQGSTIVKNSLDTQIRSTSWTQILFQSFVPRQLQLSNSKVSKSVDLLCTTECRAERHTIRLAPTIYSPAYAPFPCNPCILHLYVQSKVCCTLLPNAACSLRLTDIFAISMHPRSTPERGTARSHRLSECHYPDYAAELERSCRTSTFIIALPQNSRESDQSPRASLYLSESDMVASLPHPPSQSSQIAPLHASETPADCPEPDHTARDKYRLASHVFGREVY